MHSVSSLSGALAAALLASQVLAQAPADVPADDIPAPADFFDDYGRGFTAHHVLLDYFEAVAEASPRVRLETYGETYEGRPLTVAYVSSADNIARLEALREQHLRATGMAEGASAKTGNDAETPADAAPLAVVWLSCSVHGNEIAGSEASPRILYDLATATSSVPGGRITDADLARYLERAVVILDPSLNPDGYTRYTDDARRRATTFLQPDPSAWEHHEPWPGGRTNHYGFDLNRDWAWATQAETQQRLRLYRRWQPHVHADLHEMGVNSTYYFAPAAEPFHAYITDHQREMQRRMGASHAAIFDQQGWLYFTREVYDLLYPSYGDTYPTFNGAIGMTYEQGGSGRAGRAYRRAEGDTLTLAQRMAHHHAAALSTVAVAADNAEALTAAMAAYRRRARDGGRGGVAAYAFPLNTNPLPRLRGLTRVLDAHGIAYGQTATDLVVPLRQPQGTLAQVLLEPENLVPDSLTYDITAWSLPAVLGLDVRSLPSDPGRLASFGDSPPPPSTATAPAYGYAVPVEAFGSWAAIAPLLRTGLVARYSPRATTVDERRLPAGSILVLARDQADAALYETGFAALRAAGLSPKPLTTGFVSAGLDLGSSDVRRVDAPTVVLIQSDELDVNAFGHVWHLFERRLGYPIRPVPYGELDARALADVDVVIATDGLNVPEGRPLDALGDWVRGGGRLIAMEGAAEAFGRTDAFPLETGAAKSGRLRTGDDGEPDPMAPYAERQRAGLTDNSPGALVAAAVDNTHPIGFGLPADVYVLRAGHRPWPFLSGAGVNVVGIRARPEIRGFVGSDIRGELDETLAVGVVPVGRGSVVYAADDLAYRGFWEVGMQLLANAVFYR